MRAEGPRIGQARFEKQKIGTYLAHSCEGLVRGGVDRGIVASVTKRQEQCLPGCRIGFGDYDFFG